SEEHTSELQSLTNFVCRLLLEKKNERIPKSSGVIRVITPENCQLMARYKRWMNSRIYALCANLPDDERKSDRGVCFGWVHATLNHLLWGDRSWLGRFIGEPYRYPAFGADMYDDFAQLAEERDITDGKILTWAQSVTPEWLAGSLRYT